MIKLLMIAFMLAIDLLIWQITDLHAEVDGKPILKGLSLAVNAGETQKLLGIRLEGRIA